MSPTYLPVNESALEVEPRTQNVAGRLQAEPQRPYETMDNSYHCAALNHKFRNRTTPLDKRQSSVGANPTRLRQIERYRT